MQFETHTKKHENGKETITLYVDGKDVAEIYVDEDFVLNVNRNDTKIEGIEDLIDFIQNNQ